MVKIVSGWFDRISLDEIVNDILLLTELKEKYSLSDFADYKPRTRVWEDLIEAFCIYGDKAKNYYCLREFTDWAENTLYLTEMALCYKVFANKCLGDSFSRISSSQSREMLALISAHAHTCFTGEDLKFFQDVLNSYNGGEKHE